ncbi:hypothetical protein F7725_005049, partial [Dissostichus mawsoni]
MTATTKHTYTVSFALIGRNTHFNNAKFSQFDAKAFPMFDSWTGCRDGREACPHKLGSTNQLRLLLFILIPTISLLAGLLLVLALTGIFGGGVPLPSPKPIADSDPGYHGNSTSPSPSLETENVTNSLRNFSEGNVTTYDVSVSTAPTATSYSSSSQATPTQPYTTTPDWLTSVTSLSTAWPISSTAATDSGVCQLIDEPQCNNMLPYNLTWLSSSVAVVKSSEVDMLLRRVVLPCFSFCEAAREGCELSFRCLTPRGPTSCAALSSPTQPSLYLHHHHHHLHHLLHHHHHHRPRQQQSPPLIPVTHRDRSKGNHLCAAVNDHFLCTTGICVPQKLVCNGYNDCDDWSDETHCVCNLSLEHRCGDGRCVSRDWLCDGDHDCLDKSDEVNCSCKSQGLMECRNGACIPSAFRCDGEDDCKDGSDEEHCSKENQGLCPPGQPSCISTSSCDPQNNNNNSNCTRCEAISLELCMNLPYNQTIFPNFLGHLSQRESSVSWESSLFPALVQTGCHPFLMFYACTLLVPKCDPVTLQRVPPCRSLCRGAKEKCESVLGIVGLQWPEDSTALSFLRKEETSAVCCRRTEWTCSPSHFKCRSGRCVLSSKRCDGHLDCEDHSDEDNCGCSERALFECPGSSVCIKHSMICDGFPDCPLLRCVRITSSPVRTISVHRTLWCDGKRHCSDSSDEWDCVSLTDSVLTVFRTAAEYQVCADEWNQELSNLTCKKRKGTALQGRLEKRSHACHSRRRVSVLCSREECGRRPAAGLPPLRQKRILGDVVSRQKRILGGRVSRKGAWPWQCSLQSGPSGHVCGCVLIGRRWALTVAHCFEGGRGLICGSEIHRRPPPIQPGRRRLRYQRRAARLRVPFKLQEGEVRIISLSQCQSYFDMKTITPRMLCAGYEAGTVDSCMGDSGGPLRRPLVCSDSSGRWTLFGLTSWGSVCFSKVLGPGVYSNVTHFTSWIQQQIYTH